jgi:hypothetical protein
MVPNDIAVTLADPLMTPSGNLSATTRLLQDPSTLAREIPPRASATSAATLSRVSAMVFITPSATRKPRGGPQGSRLPHLTKRTILMLIICLSLFMEITLGISAAARRVFELE